MLKILFKSAGVVLSLFSGVMAKIITAGIRADLAMVFWLQRWVVDPLQDRGVTLWAQYQGALVIWELVCVRRMLLVTGWTRVLEALVVVVWLHELIWPARGKRKRLTPPGEWEADTWTWFNWHVVEPFWMAFRLGLAFAAIGDFDLVSLVVVVYLDACQPRRPGPKVKVRRAVLETAREGI